MKTHEIPMMCVDVCMEALRLFKLLIIAFLFVEKKMNDGNEFLGWKLFGDHSWNSFEFETIVKNVLLTKKVEFLTLKFEFF